MIIESTSVSLTLMPGASLGISLGEMCPNSAPITPAAATTLGRRSALFTSYPFLSRNLITRACCGSPNTPSDFPKSPLPAVRTLLYSLDDQGPLSLGLR